MFYKTKAQSLNLDILSHQGSWWLDACFSMFKIPCVFGGEELWGTGSHNIQFQFVFVFVFVLLLLMFLKYNEFSSSMCRSTRGDPLQTTKWLRCCGCSRFLFLQPFLQQTPQNVWQRVWRNSSAKAGMGKHNKEDTFRLKVWLWVPKNGIFSRHNHNC